MSSNQGVDMIMSGSIAKVICVGKGMVAPRWELCHRQGAFEAAPQTSQAADGRFWDFSYWLSTDSRI